jgi:hypothetical protein
MQLFDKSRQGVSAHRVHQVRAQTLKGLLAVLMNKNGGSLNAHLF